MNVSMLAAIVVLISLSSARGWDFGGVVPQDAPVVSVALWESKALLAVPRVWHDPREQSRIDLGPGAGTLFLHDGPTLLQAPWPEPEAKNASSTARISLARRQQQHPRAFPNLQEQVLGECSSLQSVNGLAVEAGRAAAAAAPGRLWVLDSGEAPSHGPSHSLCPPKVVVFSLRGSNQKLLSRAFDGVPGRGVSGLALDTFRGPTADTRAYIGYPEAPGGSSLIVVSWKSKSFWHVRLTGMQAVSTSAPPRAPQQHEVPASKHQSRQWDVALMKTTKRRPRMIVTDRDAEDIFDVSLDALRGPQPETKYRNEALVPAAELGARRLARKPWPGTSCGLLGDADGGLLYFLVYGAAAMRWDPRRGAGSKGHAVVMQDNATLPLSSAFFLDGQGGAWAACTTFAHHSYSSIESESGPERGARRPRPRIRQRASRRNPRAAPQFPTFGAVGLRDGSEEHAAEPQEFVCMAPAPWSGRTATSSRSQTMAGSRAASSSEEDDIDDAKTIMVTRRTGRTRHSDPAVHRNMLVSEEDMEEAVQLRDPRRPRPSDRDGHGEPGETRAVRQTHVHCVKLLWDGLRDKPSN